MHASAAPQKLALSITETAAALSIGEQTIRNQLSAGKFPIPPRRIGDRVLFSVRDIEAFLAGTLPQPAKPGRPRSTARGAL